MVALKQKKVLWAGLACTAVLAGTLALSGCKNEEQAGEGIAANTGPKTIKLGVTSGMTGGTATYGQSMYRGVQQAVDEINAKGGVNGKKIELQVEDNGGKADQAVTVAQKLISSDNVLAIIGDLLSSCSLAIAPICQKEQIPMVTPTSTTPEVTSKGNYIFQTCFDDGFQGRVGARFAMQHLKVKKVAVLIDNKSDYSRGLAKAFTDEFSKNGKVVATAYYAAGDSDFRPQLTSIKGKSPEALFIPGYYTEVGLIAQQARQLGIKQPMFGGDGWESSKLAEIGKSAVEGSYFSTHYYAENNNPLVKKFVADYKKRNNDVAPDTLAALAYDATLIMVDAIKKSGVTNSSATSRSKLRDALAKTKNFSGVTGNISMDENRKVVKPAIMLQVKSKKFAYVTIIKP
jgi:branched-chain amino acid transport system substrate-binding protein